MDGVSVEHRGARRSKTLLGARIVFNGGGSILDCLVRNLSANGARLQIENALSPPDRFTLAISDGRTLSCSVIWRQHRAVGVQFETAD